MNVDHSVAEEFLTHHGIKGMKWGVRRTPQQLGHTLSKKVPSGNKKAPKVVGTKTPGKAFRKSTSISDEELQKRINRLNMEERYEDLVSRQNARHTGGVRKAISEGFSRFGHSILNAGVDYAAKKLADKMFGEKDGDISIDDPSTASTSKLKKATDRLKAIDEYNKAKNPKKEDDDPRTKYDLDADPKTLGIRRYKRLFKG